MTQTSDHRRLEDLCLAIREAPKDAPVEVPFNGGLWRWTAKDSFAETLRPKWLAAPAYFGLNRYLPARIQFLVLMLMFPWSLPRWMGLRRQLLQQWVRQPLLEALRQHPGPVRIQSAPGARFFVRALLKVMELEAEIVDLPPDSRGRSAVVGESQSYPLPKMDAPKEALLGVYMPLWYTREIKRPGARYITRGILMDDFAFWLLAAMWVGLPLWAIPLQALALGMLLLAFWCIYEIGYRENDEVAIRYESNPTLSKNIHRANRRPGGWAPWIWAASLGAAATALVEIAREQPTLEHAAMAYGGFMLALIVTRRAFGLFNSLPKTQRVWVFPILHLGRNFSFALVVPISMLGGSLLLANTLARTVPYSIYRITKIKTWQNYPEATLRLGIVLSFGLLLLLSMPAPGLTEFLTAAAIIGWCVHRARHELKSLRDHQPSD